MVDFPSPPSNRAFLGLFVYLFFPFTVAFEVLPLILLLVVTNPFRSDGTKVPIGIPMKSVIVVQGEETTPSAYGTSRVCLVAVQALRATLLS